MEKAKPKGSLRVFAALMAFVLAMGLAPMLAFAAQGGGSGSLVAGGADVSTNANSANVYVTISNAGKLVLAHESVTVTDVDGDGTLSFDDAMRIAHDKYCKNGYASSGGWVSKLWGVETMNIGVATNDVVMSTGVSEAVKAGDDLVAIVLQDGTDYSDRIAYFDRKTATVMAGETLKLNLKGTTIMNSTPSVKALAGVQVGTSVNGAFTALKGKTTDSSGNVALSFSDPGTYIVSASGTVFDEATEWNPTKKDCPISAPVCIVTVNASLDKAVVTLEKSKSAYTGKAQKGVVKSVTLGGKTLKAGTDYTVSATAGKKVGSYAVTVTGKGYYTGTAKANFAITKAAAKVKVVKKKVVKASALKKKLTKYTAIKLTTDGKKAFKVVKADKKNCIKFKSGKVTVKKGTKAGTYTIKVKASAKAGKNYLKLKAKTYTIKVIVK